MKIRKIIHIDMDAFYAAVEQRDKPQWRGLPVIVGGEPDSRGVVATCSYEARRYGIHSAMPSHRAYQLCPRAVFVRPRFKVYQGVSRQIRAIFHEYTHLVEPLSLDEAFLDVTVNNRGMDSATLIAREIKNRIVQETGLTASAGVSFNKFLAKIASDYHKPDGLTVITPVQAEKFLEKLPIGRFFGVGKVTEEKMKQLGIETGADLKCWSLEDLRENFGKAGAMYFDFARARDYRPVNPHRVRKSLGKEITLQQDEGDPEKIIEILSNLAEQVAVDMSRRELYARTVTLKLKFRDFQTITRSTSVRKPVQSAREIMISLPALLTQADLNGRSVRLLGITLSRFMDIRDYNQISRQLVFPFIAESQRDEQ